MKRVHRIVAKDDKFKVEFRLLFFIWLPVTTAVCDQLHDGKGDITEGVHGLDTKQFLFKTYQDCEDYFKSIVRKPFKHKYKNNIISYVFNTTTGEYIYVNASSTTNRMINYRGCYRGIYNQYADTVDSLIVMIDENNAGENKKVMKIFK